MLATILLIAVIVLAVGSLPHWPYSQGWGYYPSSGFGTVLAAIIILLVLGII